VDRRGGRSLAQTYQFMAETMAAAPAPRPPGLLGGEIIEHAGWTGTWRRLGAHHPPLPYRPGQYVSVEKTPQRPRVWRYYTPDHRAPAGRTSSWLVKAVGPAG